MNRILLLTTAHTYRANAFLDAAKKLGIEAVQAVDMATPLAEEWQVELGLDFSQVGDSAQTIVDYAQKYPLDAVLSVDDSGSLLAARVCELLKLSHNSSDAALAARNKYEMRRMIAAAGLLCPWFQRHDTSEKAQRIAQEISYPCVVKPLTLSGSRGVMRVNNGEELVVAVTRLTRLLNKIKGHGTHPYLIEEYIPGVEVALEGLLDNGKLTALALFDKPDPLVGPFFEETIYVTPSRLPDDVQDTIHKTVAKTAQALGLRTGPVHAELRINEKGAWIVEIAGRTIGGLCSRTLEFGMTVTLEELVLRQACGFPLDILQKIQLARGVMMIPIPQIGSIPQAGLLREVAGIEEARSIPLIDDVIITARLNYPLTPLPEGESYLGFIFAKGNTPEQVETALRQAHEKLSFQIDPLLSIIS